MNGCIDLSTFATVVTAAASIFVSYHLQRPYVRVVKMFVNGKPDPTRYKLKNAGAATAVCVVLQDRYKNPIELDVKLGQQVGFVDAIPPGGEITVIISSDVVPLAAYYENLFGLLFATSLKDAGNRFRMTSRQVWWGVPSGNLGELPQHWWRRR